MDFLFLGQRPDHHRSERLHKTLLQCFSWTFSGLITRAKYRTWRNQAGKYLFRKFLFLFVARRLPVVVGLIFMVIFLRTVPLEKVACYRRVSERYQGPGLH